MQFGIGDVKEGEKINIAIEQSFDKPDFDINAEMNKQWTKWNKNKDKKSKKLTTLFENGENTWKFATEWVVNFDGKIIARITFWSHDPRVYNESLYLQLAFLF